MKLEYARQVKNSALQTVMQQMTALGAPNQIGLGLSKKGNENVLAVRLFGKKTSWKNNLVNWLQRVSFNELDVQVCDVPMALPPVATPQEDTWHRGRVRPLKIGVSISHGKVTAGTLGCFVKDKSGTLYMLSNNHVIANQNDARAEDPICQPGTYDRGSIAQDTVANLSRFVKIKPEHNLVDAAVAVLNKDAGKPDLSSLFGLGKLKGAYSGDIEVGDTVAKFGRTTGTTIGKITAVEMDNVAVGYSGGVMVFDDQIEIEGAEDGPFCQGGDSGSMVVSAPKGRQTREHEALGLLFAGGSYGGTNGQGYTYVNYMKHVLKVLDVKIAC